LSDTNNSLIENIQIKNMKQILLSSTMLILLSGLFLSFDSTSKKAGALDGFSATGYSVNGMSIQKVDAIAEKTCGGGDGTLIMDSWSMK